MKFLDKLQKLDNTKKQIILWSIIVILAIVFFFLWLNITKWRLTGITKEDLTKGITLPDIEIPTFTMPTLPEQLPSDVNLQ